MLKKLRTEFVFGTAGLIGLLSVAALFSLGLKSIPFVLLAHGYLIWALVKSETDGFIKTHGMPRAGDPQREFHPLQSFVLFIIALTQVAVAAYHVLVA